MFRKFILAMVGLVLSSTQLLAGQPLYIAKIPVPRSANVIEVPIFSSFLSSVVETAEYDVAHRLRWGMQQSLASLNPLQHHKLGLRIAQIKDELKGHAAVFDADLLTEGMDVAAKMDMNYQQLAEVYADVVRSLQQSAEFKQAFELKDEDMIVAEDGWSELRDNYSHQLKSEEIGNLELISRLVRARLDAIVHSSDTELMRNDLAQNFAVLDIAQENIKFGSSLALHFALLHHLYQQQIALRLPLVNDNTEHNTLNKELQFHQAREKFHRALYLMLQQNKP